jgi:hypothetical protein
VQTAFLVTLKAGKFFAELLLGKCIEFAVSGRDEGVVAVYVLVSAKGVKV